MARKPKVTPAQIAEAYERVARGETRQAVAGDLGISAAALGQRLKKYVPPAAPPATSVLDPPERIAAEVEHAADDTAITPDELRVRMSKLIKQLERQARAPGLNDLERRKIQESIVKTYSAYQRVISRDDPDVIAMSREDIQRRANELRALFLQRANSGRPQHCEACGVRLAQSWAREVVES